MTIDLEREYRPSVTVPDAALYFDRYRTESERTRAELHCERTLAFGPTADEVLDLFPGRAGALLLVFLHGGYWQAFSKDDFSFAARGPVAHGLHVAIVNYALAPAVTLEIIVAQARRSLAWLQAQERFRDTPVVVAGHSAGGHLAAMCALASTVAGVVTISGLHDLRPLVYTSINDALGLDEERACALSPMFAPPLGRPRVYATAGARETASFHQQGRSFAAAWAGLGCETEYVDSPGDHHFSIVEQLAQPHSAIVRACLALAR